MTYNIYPSTILTAGKIACKEFTIAFHSGTPTLLMATGDYSKVQLDAYQMWKVTGYGRNCFKPALGGTFDVSKK